MHAGAPHLQWIASCAHHGLVAAAIIIADDMRTLPSRLHHSVLSPERPEKWARTVCATLSVSFADGFFEEWLPYPSRMRPETGGATAPPDPPRFFFFFPPATSPRFVVDRQAKNSIGEVKKKKPSYKKNRKKRGGPGGLPPPRFQDAFGTGTAATPQKNHRQMLWFVRTATHP